MNPHHLLDTAMNGDPLDALTSIRELQHLLREQQLHHVLTLRRHGANWVRCKASAARVKLPRRATAAKVSS